MYACLAYTKKKNQSQSILVSRQSLGLQAACKKQQFKIQAMCMYSTYCPKIFFEIKCFTVCHLQIFEHPTKKNTDP